MVKTMGTPHMDGLVIRARHDTDALGLLYERHYDRVFCYCMRRLFVRGIAEDVTATTFLNVARHIREFPGTTENDLLNWLYAIATNEVNSFIRITKRREQLMKVAMEERMAIEAAKIDGEESFHRLDWPTLYEAILGLNPRHQSAIMLRFWEGLEHQAIAEVLGCSPTAVRVTLMRAIRKLRKRLKRDTE